MRDDSFRPVPDALADEDWLGQAPDLRPMRAAAELGELADAKACLAGSYGLRLRDDDPWAPLARDLAEALTLAGLTLHHCAQSDPRYRLGGACLLPVASGGFAGEPGGVAVSWTPHSLLTLDWDRWAQSRHIQDIVNRRLPEVLDALGFAVQPFGVGGASLVTGRRAEGRPEASR